jgi:hypothetical protein
MEQAREALKKLNLFAENATKLEGTAAGGPEIGYG